MNGNITDFSFSNVQRGKPIVRVFKMQGYGITMGSEFKEFDGFIDLDNTLNVENHILFQCMNASLGSEDFRINNTIYTP